MEHVGQPDFACPKCSGVMDIGRTEVEGSYRSKNQKFMSKPTRYEKACACLHCGYVEFYVDPKKLRKAVSSW
jgi:predicted nucleic-acid-binding Zn-ribbon protein